MEPVLGGSVNGSRLEGAEYTASHFLLPSLWGEDTQIIGLRCVKHSKELAEKEWRVSTQNEVHCPWVLPELSASR